MFKKYSLKFFFFLAFCLTLPLSAQAEGGFFSQLSGKDAPLTIDSEAGVEWNRTEKYFIAKKKVVVKRNDVTLASDQVKALYVEDEKGNTIPTVFIATGNVKLTSKDSALNCEKLIYHLNDKHAVATGKKLLLKHEKMSLKANKSIEFWMDKKIAKVLGAVELNKEGQIIKSDMAKAYFDKNQKKMVLKKVEAEGHVVLISEGNIIQGQKGTYDVDQGKAEVEGDVKISQGSHFLTAQKAEYDFKTQKSTLVGKSSITYGGSNKPKVQGIIVPGQMDKKQLPMIKN